MIRTFSLITVILCSLALIGCSGSDSSKAKTKANIKNVMVPGSNNSFALILPKSYPKKRSYPLLVCLNPGGDGKAHVAHFSSLADELDIIIAGSNVYRNNVPHTVFIPAIEGTIRHLRKTYKVNEEEVFLTGLSGGGMACYVCAFFMKFPFAGILVNNGAVHGNFLSSPTDTKEIKTKAIAIIGGKQDTVVTMARLKSDVKFLEHAGHKVKLFSFSGGHELAPIAKCKEALQWLMGK